MEKTKQLKETINNAKAKLKEKLTPDTSKEVVDLLTDIDKELDSVSSKADEVEKDYDELKSDFINSVKEQRFKPNGKETNPNNKGEKKSFEESFKEFHKEYIKDHKSEKEN